MNYFTKAIILTSATTFFALLALAQSAGATPPCHANNDKTKTCNNSTSQPSDVRASNSNDVDVTSVNVNATKSVSNSASNARSTSNAQGGVGYGGRSDSYSGGNQLTSTQSASGGSSSSLATGSTNVISLNNKHEASRFFPALAPAAYGTSSINGATRSTAGLYINAGVSEVAGSFASVGVSVPLTSDAAVKKNHRLQNRLLELQVQHYELLIKQSMGVLMMK